MWMPGTGLGMTRFYHRDRFHRLLFESDSQDEAVCLARKNYCPCCLIAQDTLTVT
jgi:hypothetical protein